MNDAEQETIGLCIALEAIDDIVNHALLDVRDSSVPGEASVYFKELVHQEMFLVRLLDFSKECGTKSVTGVAGSCLDVLQAACSTQSFNVRDSVAGLAVAVTALQDWLGTTRSLRIWMPTLGIDAQLSVPRSQLLFILGNHVKHNLARLTGVSKELSELLATHGYAVKPEQVPLTLNEIRESLQGYYFGYYCTWLAELVNNVRWGIYDYLRPTFSTAFTRIPGDDVGYEYRFPSVISDTVAREWFWRLMNHVRVAPIVKRFVGSRDLKKTAPLEWDAAPPEAAPAAKR
jgi:hypothetical protein